MEQLNNLWNFRLLSHSSGNSITLGDIGLVVLTLVSGWLLGRVIGFFISRHLSSTRIHTDGIDILKRVSFYLIGFLTLLTALGLLGIPITVFAFATGAIAIGLGFGAQNVINNFISGWILLAERPIRRNDLIEIGGAIGQVDRVGTRSTQIRRTDGVHMLVPNSQLLENTVTNWTLIDNKIRTSLRVGVAYSSDPQKVSELLRVAVFEQTEVLDDPAVEIVFEDFADSALLFEAFFWCDVLQDKSIRMIRSEIRHRIYGVFNEAGIDIAFPQRDIHLNGTQPLPIIVQTAPKETSESSDSLSQSIE